MTNEEMDARTVIGAEMIKFISKRGIVDELGDTGDPGHLFGGCAMILVDDVLICFHRERDGIGVSAPIPPDEVNVIPPVLGPQTILLGMSATRKDLVSAARRQARAIKSLYAELEIGSKPSPRNKRGDDDRLDEEYDKFYGPR